MEKLAHLDRWIIQNFLEPLYWFIEANIGVNNFTCARALLLGYPVFGSMYIAENSTDTFQTYQERLFIVACVCVAVLWYSFSVERRTTAAKSNPLRNDPLLQFTRAGHMLFASVFTVASGFSLLAVSIDMLIVALYSISCNTRPPESDASSD